MYLPLTTSQIKEKFVRIAQNFPQTVENCV